MRGKGLIAVLALVGIMTAGSAWSSDKIQASVPVTSPTAVVTPNGMAVGTIHVIYTVNAYAFTPGDFGSFNVDLSILPVSGNPETSYELTLKLVQKQEGAGNLILNPAQGIFSVPGSAFSDGTVVNIAIPENPPDYDGATLTGTLQLEAEGALDNKGKATNPQLNTNTSIVVKVVLMHPTACLKVVNFVTDNEFNALDSAVVNLKTKSGVTTVTSTNPGQFSDNVLIVNNCEEDQNIDLKVTLDPTFDTNPSGNPGQAVFTYLATGEVDEENFDISAFGSGTAQGQSLCLSDLTIPNGQTLLTTVHMGAIKGTLFSALPADSSFDFSASIFATGSNSCTDGTPHPLADTNPAAAIVPYATK